MYVIKYTFFVLALMASLNASATILTFDDIGTQAGNGFYNIGNSYSFGDYQITGTPPFPSSFAGFYAYQTESLNWTGSIGLTYFDVSARIELTSISGASFSIDSIDISRGDGNSGLIPVGFTGNKSDGTQVSKTYWFTDSVQGKSEQFNFSSQFQDLTSLVWEQGAEWHQFDNITVSAVPEPSTIFLFALSLPFLLVSINRNKCCI